MEWIFCSLGFAWRAGNGNLKIHVGEREAAGRSLLGLSSDYLGGDIFLEAHWRQ